MSPTVSYGDTLPQENAPRPTKSLQLKSSLFPRVRDRKLLPEHNNRTYTALYASIIARASPVTAVTCRVLLPILSRNPS